MRRKRSDRNHLIYLITSLTGDTYIGITVCLGRAIQKSLKGRLEKHIHRALTEDKNWPICEAIRLNPKSFSISLLEVVRGKRNAHEREISLIKERNPSLNLKGNYANQSTLHES